MLGHCHGMVETNTNSNGNVTFEQNRNYELETQPSEFESNLYTLENDKDISCIMIQARITISISYKDELNMVCLFLHKRISNTGKL